MVTHQSSSSPNIVTVKTQKDNVSLSIAFTVVDEDPCSTEPPIQISICRPLNEPLEKTMARIQKGIDTFITKREQLNAKALKQLHFNHADSNKKADLNETDSTTSDQPSQKQNKGKGKKSSNNNNSNSSNNSNNAEASSISTPTSTSTSSSSSNTTKAADPVSSSNKSSIFKSWKNLTSFMIVNPAASDNNNHHNNNNNAIIPLTETNENAWKSGYQFHVGDHVFDISLNLPSVVSLTIDSIPLVGFPLLPVPVLEHAELSSCSWKWFSTPSTNEATTIHESKKLVSTQRIYVPTENDLNSILVCECTPAAQRQQQQQQQQQQPYKDDTAMRTSNSLEVGASFQLELSTPVTLFHDTIPYYPLPFDCRSDLTRAVVQSQFVGKPQLTNVNFISYNFNNQYPALAKNNPTNANSFRVVCYNILADTYATTNYAKTHLFPYTPQYALKDNYRKALITRELTRYNGDIVCLQEVEQKFFTNYLHPYMVETGYDGLFARKTRAVSEGSAIFYRTNKFEFISNHTIELNRHWAETLNCTPITELLRSHPGLQKKFNTLSTIAQFMILKSPRSITGLEKDKIVIAGNTHLYFHPKANNFRIMQIALVLAELEHLKQQTQQQFPTCDVSVVLSGDFNSYPFGAVYKFISTNSLSDSHPNWEFSLEYEDKEEGDINSSDNTSNTPSDSNSNSNSQNTLENTSSIPISVNLQHNLCLESACGLPLYTNFVASFKECLDYIFIDKTGLKVDSFLPYPSHEEVSEHVALPSVVFPSDHIASIADITWL